MIKAGLSRSNCSALSQYDRGLEITKCDQLCRSSGTLAAIALALLVVAGTHLGGVAVFLAPVLLVSVTALGLAFLIILLWILGLFRGSVWHG
jgi:hypothetical protein